jgi:hypothetical protein
VNARTAKKLSVTAARTAGAFASRSVAARKAWATRTSPRYRAARSERTSKEALSAWAKARGWRLVFFEGSAGAPRTGIVDAVLLRLARAKADVVEVRLVQLKAGAGGLTAREIARLKSAVQAIRCEWVLAAFDGTELHFVPGDQHAGHGVEQRAAPDGQRAGERRGRAARR